ncbi:Cnbp [Columba guinea]|nr:Cnbp [Columba guinea]
MESLSRPAGITRCLEAAQTPSSIQKQSGCQSQYRRDFSRQDHLQHNLQMYTEVIHWLHQSQQLLMAIGPTDCHQDEAWRSQPQPEVQPAKHKEKSFENSEDCQHGCYGNGHKQEHTGFQFMSSSLPDICYRCGESGHLAKDCDLQEDGKYH